MRRRTKILLGLAGALVVFGAALAWRLHTWGQPVPAAYRRDTVTPGDSEGGRSLAYLRLDPGPEMAKRYVAVDSDGDGTADLVLVEGAHVASFARPRPDDPEARWLILCLDGVPYEEFRALWEEGHFREFFRPVPVISPFPSASGLALSDLFHTGQVAGYEDGYFDRARNQLAGGALKTSTLADMSYVQAFDYDLPGRWRGLAYVLPIKSYHADLNRLRQRFLQSRQKVYVAHLATSDSVYHVVPREEVRPLLLEVDSVLRELYFGSQGKLRLTLLSDHGNSNNLVPSRPVPLEAHLSAGGWRLAKQLEAPRDVVVPAYGLMGFFAVYCAPEQRTELARHLAALPGADFAVYAEANSAVIESARGRARLAWKPDGSAFRYQPETGDPLALAEILARLKQEGKIDADGWVSDGDFFAATRDHFYPDPAYRLWQWATNHVRNRAEVVMNLQPGFHYGSTAFEWVVEMLSTHGSFDRAQSLGFATSTDGPWAGPFRTGDLLPPNLPDLKRAASARRNSKIETRNSTE